MSRKDKGSLNKERPVTKAFKFPSFTRKSFLFCFCLFVCFALFFLIFFLHLNWNGKCEECIQRETMTGTVAGYVKKKERKKKRKKSGYLKNNLVFDWQPVKCLEQWSNMLTSALARTTPAASACTSDHS